MGPIASTDADGTLRLSGPYSFDCERIRTTSNYYHASQPVSVYAYKTRDFYLHTTIHRLGNMTALQETEPTSMKDIFEKDLYEFRALLVELEQRGGHHYLEQLFIEQIDLREGWLADHNETVQ